MAKECPPWPAGHCSSMDNDKTVIGSHFILLQLGAFFQKTLKGGISTAAGLEVHEFLDGRERSSVGLDHLLVFIVHKYHFRFTVIQIKADLLGRQPPVDRKGDGTKGGGRTVNEKIFQAVLSQNTDPITLFNATFLKSGGQPIHFGSDLGKCDGFPGIRLVPGRRATEGIWISTDKIVNRKIVERHSFLLKCAGSWIKSIFWHKTGQKAIFRITVAWWVVDWCFVKQFPPRRVQKKYSFTEKREPLSRVRLDRGFEAILISISGFRALNQFRGQGAGRRDSGAYT